MSNIGVRSRWRFEKFGLGRASRAGEPRTRIARFSARKRPATRRTVSGMRRTIMAIALGLTACASSQSGASGYQDARFTQADELNCRDQASAAATHPYE